MNRQNLISEPNTILICRADKLGDFILSLPSFVLIKKALPNTKIIALTQEYTKPIAELCDAIDEIITIPQSDSKITTIKNIISTIKPLKIDVSISLFTTATLAIGLLMSKIPIRISPATKIDQLFYNYKLRQRRSQSLKPEFEYNLDLVKYYLSLNNVNYNNDIKKPIIKFPKEVVTTSKRLFCSNYNLEESKKLFFIHVGSGGSANNLSPQRYAKLINLLSTKIDASFILCEGPEDSKNVQLTINSINSNNYVQYLSNKGLLEFTKNIAIADFFISGSTGPLHIAGALDIPTVGFYPNRRSATSIRWRTLNSEKNTFSFSPIDHADMESIDLDEVVLKIKQFISN